LGNRGFCHGTYKNRSSWNKRPCRFRRARAEFDPHYIELVGCLREKAPVAAAEVEQLPFALPMKGVGELALGCIATQWASEAREKHEHRPVDFATRDFHRIVVDPVVLGGLRVIRERFVTDKDHPATRAFHDVPPVTLENEIAIERAAQRARPRTVIVGLVQGTLEWRSFSNPRNVITGLAWAWNTREPKASARTFESTNWWRILLLC
jgi:hypothetical protein